MVVHFLYKKNDGKMRGVTLCPYQGPIVKVLFSRCNSVWPKIPRKFLDDYVEDERIHVVDFKQ